ncbi:Hypothetical predicted protein [Xyrichtys novacula]|uniref:Uncharacterized protein n=1 Tax=Xyrichtys novacula TaxID=13765 RepID=A0AAV1FEH1_XYRNO|nr:Hypothetical predicted protein [Xyrichtys novacula]
MAVESQLPPDRNRSSVKRSTSQLSPSLITYLPVFQVGTLMLSTTGKTLHQEFYCFIPGSGIRNHAFIHYRRPGQQKPYERCRDRRSPRAGVARQTGQHERRRRSLEVQHLNSETHQHLGANMATNDTFTDILLKGWTKLTEATHAEQMAFFGVILFVAAVLLFCMATCVHCCCCWCYKPKHHTARVLPLLSR